MRIRALVLAVLLAGCSGGGSGGEARPTPTGNQAERIRTGGSPCGVVTAAGSVWVSDAADGRLLKVDPVTHAFTQTATLDDAPCEMTAAFGSVWVTTQSGFLDRVDPATGAVTARVRVGEKSYETAATADALWVSDRDSAQLTRVDPLTLRTSVLPLPGTHPGGLVHAFGALWVGDDTAGSSNLLRVDPRTRAVRRVPAGHRPAYVAATATAVWVSEVEEGTVSRIDPVTLARRTVATGTSPVNLDVLDGDLWVPDDVGDAVFRVDGTDVVVTEEVAAAGMGPAVVAPVGDQVWVTMFGGGEVWVITPRG
jgi:streptogramin lyase